MALQSQVLNDAVRAMPLIETISELLARASRALGLETVDSFPPAHPYARTRWNRAYFDIASDLSPEQIERKVCDAIANTPAVFAHIVHPTPAMQRALLAVIHARMRMSCGQPVELAAMLVAAYASRHTPEAAPGLRAAIESSAGEMPDTRAWMLLGHLGAVPSTFGIIDER